MVVRLMNPCCLNISLSIAESRVLLELLAEVLFWRLMSTCHAVIHVEVTTPSSWAARATPKSLPVDSNLMRWVWRYIGFMIYVS